MTLPVQVTYRNVAHSEKLEALVNKEAAKLKRFFDRIVSCRVAIERAHVRHGAPYHVRIDLTVPGDELAISHEPSVRPNLLAQEEASLGKSAEVDGDRKDAEQTVREAFRKATRRLREYARKKAGL